MDLFDPNWWVSAGILSALVTALSIIIQVILNKKLRTPADEEIREQNSRTWEKDAIAERNDILARYKEELTQAQARADRLQDLLNEAEAAKNGLNSSWHYWAHAAVAAIHRLGGTDEDVPPPSPGVMPPPPK